MKNVIYSVYIDVDERHIMPKHLAKHRNTKSKFEKYKGQLATNKIKYAESIGAEYIQFGDDEQYKEFKKKFTFIRNEFDAINFYKLYLMETIECDNILHLDFDVICKTDKDFFKEHDMNLINIRAINSDKSNPQLWHGWERAIDNGRGQLTTLNDPMMNYDNMIKHVDSYAMYVKNICKKAMFLVEDIYESSNWIMNTAVLGSNSEIIKSVKFFEQYHHLRDLVIQAKEESFYPDDLSRNFMPNNEVFYTYLLERDNIPWNGLPDEWHHIHSKILPDDGIVRYDDHNIEKQEAANFIHVVSKEFESMEKYL